MTKARTLANLANGTGLTLIQQEVISTAVSAVDFDLPAEYSSFMVTLNDIRATNYTNLNMQVSEDGGGTFESADYSIYAKKELLSYGATTTSTSTGVSGSSFNLSNYRSISGFFQIQRSDALFGFSGEGVVNESAYPTLFLARAFFGGQRVSASIVNAIRLYRSDDINSGTFSLYAYKETI